MKKKSYYISSALIYLGGLIVMTTYPIMYYGTVNWVLKYPQRSTVELTEHALAGTHEMALLVTLILSMLYITVLFIAAAERWSKCLVKLSGCLHKQS